MINQAIFHINYNYNITENGLPWVCNGSHCIHIYSSSIVIKDTLHAPNVFFFIFFFLIKYNYSTILNRFNDRRREMYHIKDFPFLMERKLKDFQLFISIRDKVK